MVFSMIIIVENNDYDFEASFLQTCKYDTNGRIEMES